MVDNVKVLDNGVEVYPRTHAGAIVGLSSIKWEKGDKGEQGQKGEQGLKGDPGTNATTTAVATTTTNGLMAAADKVKLNGITSITFEKVGEV